MSIMDCMSLDFTFEFLGVTRNVYVPRDYNELSKRARDIAKHVCTLGLDTESRVKGSDPKCKDEPNSIPLDVIQISNGIDTIIAHRRLLEQSQTSSGRRWALPCAFASLLSSTTYPKAGVGIEQDARDIEAYCTAGSGRLTVNHLFNLQSANIIAMGHGHTKVAIGLDELSQRLLSASVPKGMARSDWSVVPLPRRQLQYAALDAIASCLCALVLMRGRPSNSKVCFDASTNTESTIVTATTTTTTTTPEDTKHSIAVTSKQKVDPPDGQRLSIAVGYDTYKSTLPESHTNSGTDVSSLSISRGACAGMHDVQSSQRAALSTIATQVLAFLSKYPDVKFRGSEIAPRINCGRSDVNRIIHRELLPLQLIHKHDVPNAKGELITHWTL